MIIHHDQISIIFITLLIRFESGNLEKAVRITDTYYELYLRFVINNIIAITNKISILILATKNTL